MRNVGSDSDILNVKKDESTDPDKIFIQMNIDISRKIEMSFKPIQEFLDSFSKNVQISIKLASDSIAESGKCLNDIFKRVNERSRQYGFDDFDALLRNYVTITCKAGFMYDIESDINIVWDMTDVWYHAQENCKQKTVEDFWSLYYAEKIKEISKKRKLNWFSQEHVHILRESIWAYNHEKYYVAMPVLYSLIEGIYGTATKMRVNYKSINEKIAKRISFSSEEEFIKLIIFESFYKQFRFDEITEQTKSEIGRHAVMHGGSTLYGTKVNYLRLFSLLLIVLDMSNELI